MLEGPGDDHRQRQLSQIIGERGIHEAANLRASYLLAQRLAQVSVDMQIKLLAGKIDQTIRRKRAAINRGFEIVGLRYTVLDVEVSGELDNIREALRSTGHAGKKLSNAGKFVQQVETDQFSVHQIQANRSVQPARDGLRRGRAEARIYIRRQQTVQGLLNLRHRRDQLVGVNLVGLHVDGVDRLRGAHVDGDVAALRTTVKICCHGIELNESFIKRDIGFRVG